MKQSEQRANLRPCAPRFIRRTSSYARFFFWRSSNLVGIFSLKTFRVESTATISILFIKNYSKLVKKTGQKYEKNYKGEAVIIF